MSVVRSRSSVWAVRPCFLYFLRGRVRGTKIRHSGGHDHSGGPCKARGQGLQSFLQPWLPKRPRRLSELVKPWDR